MIEPLLELPAHVRERLVNALKTELLVAPYEDAAVRSAVGGDAAAVGVRDALNRLHDRGIPGRAVALALEAAARAVADTRRPDLVWSGPEVPGLHARDTRRVYEELVASAERSLWISTYAYYDGPQAFKSLAARMQAVPQLQVTLLLNIQRAARGHSSARAARRPFRGAALVSRLARITGACSFLRPSVARAPRSGRHPPCEGRDCRRRSRIRDVREPHRGGVRPQHRGRRAHT